MISLPELNLILIGDPVVDTTALVDSLRSQFCGDPIREKRHVANRGTDARPLVLHTSRGPIQFNFWDASGREHFGGFRYGDLIQSQGAMVVFDLASRNNCCVADWRPYLIPVCPDMPIAVVEINADSDKRKVRAEKLKTFAKEVKNFSRQWRNLKCFEYDSALTNSEEPFLWMARELSGDDRLRMLPTVEGLDMEPFFEWRLKVLPAAVGWFDGVRGKSLGGERYVDSKKLSAIYQFVRAFPDGIGPSTEKAGGKRE